MMAGYVKKTDFKIISYFAVKPITQPLIGDPSSAYIIHGATKSREGMEKPGNGRHIKGASKMQHVHCPPAIGTSPRFTTVSNTSQIYT